LQAKKWRVIPLAAGKNATFPPPADPPTDVFIEEEQLLSPRFAAPIVVLGPAGIGLTTFHRWIRVTADRANVGLVDLNFESIAEKNDPAKERSVLAARWFGSTSEESVSCADLTRMIEHHLGSIDTKLSERTRIHTLLRMDVLHSENKLIVLGRLRDLVERRSLRKAHLVVLAHETAPLEDTEPFSSFLAVCNVFRLADFSIADVEHMWRCWASDRAAWSSEVAEACIEWTGGQPVLVNLFLARLYEVAASDLKADELPFSKIGKWLEHHPPRGAFQHWQNELARLVSKNRFLRRRIANYAAGDTRKTITREELPLFLAGWIGQRPNGEWAIRSRAHNRWASAPLQAPERFVRRGEDQ
jgi:hypothetical protein